MSPIVSRLSVLLLWCRWTGGVRVWVVLRDPGSPVVWSDRVRARKSVLKGGGNGALWDREIVVGWVDGVVAVESVPRCEAGPDLLVEEVFLVRWGVFGVGFAEVAGGGRESHVAPEELVWLDDRAG